MSIRCACPKLHTFDIFRKERYNSSEIKDKRSRIKDQRPRIKSTLATIEITRTSIKWEGDPLTTSPPFSYVTKSEFVVEYLKEAILNGDLEPEARIDPEEIAEQLNLSPMPVRQALLRLEETGFVTRQPHRGAFVAPVSKEQIREIYLIRASLEALAARLAAECMTDDAIERLEEILSQAQIARESEDFTRLNELNAEFHTIGYETTGLPLLLKLIADLRAHSERYRRLHSQLSHRTAEAYREHGQILNAWRNRDANAAEHWVRLNIEESARTLIETL